MARKKTYVVKSTNNEKSDGQQLKAHAWQCFCLAGMMFASAVFLIGYAESRTSFFVTASLDGENAADAEVVVIDGDGIRYVGTRYTIAGPSPYQGRRSVNGTAADLPSHVRQAYTRAEGNVWLGIPYAQPIVANRDRFDNPRSLNITNVEEYNLRSTEGRASNGFGPICPQLLFHEEWKELKQHNMKMSVDCLTLNIFSPLASTTSRVNTITAKLRYYPVTILLHGGDFINGSSRDFGYIGPLHNFVSRGNVLVTLNYRLNHFGLYHPGGCEDGYCRQRSGGNRALLDIVEAIKWVRCHIQYFGGDVSRITLGGYGSGACAASLIALQSLSEKSSERKLSMTWLAMISGEPHWEQCTLVDDHFHSLMLLSGGTSETCIRETFSWNTRGELTGNACKGKEPECLRELSTSKIMEAELKSHFPIYHVETGHGMKYRHPDRLAEQALNMRNGTAAHQGKAKKKLKVLLGNSGNEWHAIELRVKDLMNFHFLHGSTYASYGTRPEDRVLKALKFVFDGDCVFEQCAPFDSLCKRIVKYYVRLFPFSEVDVALKWYWNRLYPEILNDGMIRYFIMKEAQRYAQLGADVYLYNFSPDRSFYDDQVVTLGTDMVYTFMPEQKWKQVSNRDDLDKELPIAEMMGSTLSSFVQGNHLTGSGSHPITGGVRVSQLNAFPRYANSTPASFPYLLLSGNGTSQVFNYHETEHSHAFTAEKYVLWEEFWNLKKQFSEDRKRKYRNEEVRAILKRVHQLEMKYSQIADGTPELAVEEDPPPECDAFGCFTDEEDAADRQGEEGDLEEYLYQGEKLLTPEQAQYILDSLLSEIGNDNSTREEL